MAFYRPELEAHATHEHRASAITCREISANVWIASLRWQRRLGPRIRGHPYNALRHCEEQGDEAIQLVLPAWSFKAGLLRRAYMTAVCARATAPQPSVPDGQITCPAPTTKINAFQ